MEVCFSMINKIEMRAIPSISKAEYEAIIKIKERIFTEKIRTIWHLRDEEVKQLGMFMGKYHLKRIFEYIHNSNQKVFELNFFCDCLRLSSPETHEIYLALKNYGNSGNFIYRFGYMLVIDRYFNAPIVKTTFELPTYRFVFKVE